MGIEPTRRRILMGGLLTATATLVGRGATAAPKPTITVVKSPT
jgi:hypothetical protein